MLTEWWTGLHDFNYRHVDRVTFRWWTSAESFKKFPTSHNYLQTWLMLVLTWRTKAYTIQIKNKFSLNFFQKLSFLIAKQWFFFKITFPEPQNCFNSFTKMLNTPQSAFYFKLKKKIKILTWICKVLIIMNHK